MTTTNHATEMLLGVFSPEGAGGSLRLDRLPVRDGGIHTAERVTLLRVSLDEFSMEAVRSYLPTVGFKLMDRSVHGVGYGAGFFFDFKAERL